jgi:hypothetical protein
MHTQERQNDPCSGFAVGVVFGVLATWMVVGLLSSASGTPGEQPGAPTHIPNGDPCAGQELTLKGLGRFEPCFPMEPSDQRPRRFRGPSRDPRPPC